MTPRILAIDTTGEFGSLALRGGAQADEVVLHAPDGFAAILFEALERLLERHRMRIDEVDCLAAACGPGSFTGVRIGLSAAKGLAEACGRPMVAVSNLRALAWFGSSELRAPFVDARRGEIYGGLYNASLDAVAGERVMKFSEWAASLPPGAECITADPSLFPAVKATAAPRALAGAVAVIAEREFLAGRAVNPAGIDANYVRRSDAELLWRDR